MKKFNETNAKFQCFNCTGIFTSEEWNTSTNECYEDNLATLPKDYIENNNYVNSVGEEESNPNLPSFVCPICESGPMANELIYVPNGLKVLVNTRKSISKEREYTKYTIDLVEDIVPLHKDLKKEIKSYYDYAENELFFENEKEKLNSINIKEVFDYIKENHPNFLTHIEGKGLFIYPAWIPYENLI